MRDAIEQLRAALRGRNIILPAEIIGDGKLRRCDVEGHNGSGKGDAAYLLHLSGSVPAGGFENHRDGLGWQNWRAVIDRLLAPAEIAALRQKAEAGRRQRDTDEQKQHAEAARTAKRLLQAAPGEATSHPYTLKKRVDLGPSVGRGAWLQRDWPDALLIPLYTADDALASVQAINVDGKKDYLAGGRKRGCFHPFGTIRGAASVAITEGVANAAAIVAATAYLPLRRWTPAT